MNVELTTPATRRPIFGIGSIVILFAGVGIAWAWASINPEGLNPGESAEDGLYRFFIIAGIVSAAMVIGMIAALIAFARRERLRGLAAAGLIINGIPVALIILRRLL